MTTETTLAAFTHPSFNDYRKIRANRGVHPVPIKWPAFAETAKAWGFYPNPLGRLHVGVDPVAHTDDDKAILLGVAHDSCGGLWALAFPEDADRAALMHYMASLTVADLVEDFLVLDDEKPFAILPVAGFWDEAIDRIHQAIDEGLIELTHLPAGMMGFVEVAADDQKRAAELYPLHVFGYGETVLLDGDGSIVVLDRRAETMRRSTFQQERKKALARASAKRVCRFDRLIGAAK